jgi:cbb3-type cytochrome oxidase subunit 1
MMDSYVLRFLRASLAWLAAGVSLGVAMAVQPAWVIYRTAHLHLLLLGFVFMMISGVAYHVMPRFTATPLYSPRLATWHFIMSNCGLALLASGFIVRNYDVAVAAWLLGVGGTLSAAGAYALAFNLWRTLDGAKVTPTIPVRQPRPLRVVSQ